MSDELDDKWRLTIETRLERVEHDLRDIRQAVQLFVSEKERGNRETAALTSEVTQTRVTVNTLLRMAEGVMTTQAHAIENQGAAILDLLKRVSRLEEP